MISAGVREVRNNLSKYLQRVRDEGETVEITMRGEPVALMIPIKRQSLDQEELAKRFTDLDRLIDEIGAHTIDHVGAVDTIREVRRDLSIAQENRSQEDMVKMFKGLDELAADVSTYWKDDLDAVEAVREQRRDL